VKRWPLRSRLAIWTAFFLTVELFVFGLASGILIFNEQLEAFREIRGDPTSPIVIRKEANELIVDTRNRLPDRIPGGSAGCGFRGLVDYATVPKTFARCC